MGNLSQEQDGSDDNEGDANVEAPPAPWLDPTRKPSSFGLSLSCESNEIPAFEMCITYARYEYSIDENTFTRVPRAGVIDASQLAALWTENGKKSSAIFWLKPIENDGEIELTFGEKDDSEVGLTIHARKSRLGENNWTVTFLLHSEIGAYTGEFNPDYEAQFNIHQPEIRINAGENTSLIESYQSVGIQRTKSMLPRRKRTNCKRPYDISHSVIDPQTADDNEEVRCLLPTLWRSDVYAYFLHFSGSMENIRA